MAPANAVADEPRTGITFWEALKWCNARSEKDGLEPAYYLDASEAIGDLNGDGNITAGTDTFISDPGMFNNQDTNGNGKWDPGEQFTDNAPVTGVYQPQEYVDVNGNAVYDPGLSQVFRAGANIPDFGTWVSNPASGPAGGIVSASPIKYSADGYRLPTGFVVMKLATGGNHQKKWPWGDENPFAAPAFAQLADYVLADDGPAGAAAPTKPTAATNRQPNQYGLKDLIGNVAEWSEDVWDSGPPLHIPVAVVYGGSYLGLSVADTAVPVAFGGGTANPANLFQLTLQGPLGASSPAIGFRCVSYE